MQVAPMDCNCNAEECVATSLEECTRLQVAWVGFQQRARCLTPNASPARFVAVTATKEGALLPHVVLFKTEGQPRAL